MEKRKRELLQIYYEVLKELSKGPLRTTHIMRKCNLDSRMYKHAINILASRGLIVLIDNGKSKLYSITSKGLEFMKLYESLQALLKKTVRIYE